MKSNENNFKEFKTKLHSQDLAQITDAIEYIRNNGTPEILEVIFDFLVLNKDIAVKNKILACISDIKDKNSVPFLISALSVASYKSIKKDILNAFWQTSLDFSAYSEIFVDILIHEDFEVALEALTILEIILESSEDIDKDAISKRISAEVEKNISPKKDLLLETIKILDI